MPVEIKEISVTGKEDCGIADITEEVSDAVKNPHPAAFLLN